MVLHGTPPISHTWRLSLLVEDHQVQGVVQMLRDPGQVLPCQPVGAVDGLILQVRPVHPVLDEKQDTTLH